MTQSRHQFRRSHMNAKVFTDWTIGTSTAKLRLKECHDRITFTGLFSTHTRFHMTDTRPASIGKIPLLTDFIRKYLQKSITLDGVTNLSPTLA
jgi:hypothetical protein